MEFDRSSYSLAPHHAEVVKPWGREIVYTPSGLARVGKVLFVKAGMRLSLQYHDAKEETLCLIEGEAKFWLEGADGELRPIPMERYGGYTVRLGQKHRIEAVTDCICIEVSDPEKGTTVRLSDDFARKDEDEAMRSAPNRGWQG